MKRIAVHFFFIISIFTFSCKSPTAPEYIGAIGADTDNWQSPLVDELNKHIFMLDGTSPSLGNNDLQPLSFLGNSRIVGIGEATHGTKEFFQMKHRIFKYLVENFGFKAFAFEADMGESIYIDKYVTDGVGNLEDLMVKKMLFWTWRTKEVETLLEWMRQYNTGKSESEKIHYIGVDCQVMTHQPDLLVEYFNRVKPDFVSTITPYLDMIKNMHNDDYTALYDYYSTITEGREQEIADSLNDMLNAVEGIQNELISKSSEFEYYTIRQLVVNLAQANEVIYSATHSINHSIRDKYMADNALWASDVISPTKKIALWAHNAHIAKIDTLGIESMGGYLKSYIQGQYQDICFSFSKGYFTAVSSAGLSTQLLRVAPLKSSLNYIFFNAKYDNFILRTNEIPDTTDLGKFVVGLKPFIQVGASYDGDPSKYYAQCDLKAFMDVLINIDITNYAEQLKSNIAKTKNISPDSFSLPFNY